MHTLVVPAIALLELTLGLVASPVIVIPALLRHASWKDEHATALEAGLVHHFADTPLLERIALHHLHMPIPELLSVLALAKMRLSLGNAELTIVFRIWALIIQILMSFVRSYGTTHHCKLGRLLSLALALRVAVASHSFVKESLVVLDLRTLAWATGSHLVRVAAAHSSLHVPTTSASSHIVHLPTLRERLLLLLLMELVTWDLLLLL